MTTDLTTQTKKCSKCNIPQPANSNYFWKNRKEKDGLQTWCIACQQDFSGTRKALAAKPENALYDSILTPCDPLDPFDFRNTNIWKSRHFLSGDGGYQEYIDKCNRASI